MHRSLLFCGIFAYTTSMQSEHTVQYVKTLLAVAVWMYCMGIVFNPGEWHFIDNVNLIFHEAGHYVFFFLGEYVQVAGGSLMQLLIPLVVFFHLYKTEQRYSAYLVLFWLGQSFINVSIYAGDAQKMELPLLGGSAVIHDWYYLLSHAGVLHLTPYIANTIFGVGFTFFFVALYFSLFEVWKE